MACKLIWEEKGVLFSHSGIVTNQEVMEMNNLMYGNPKFDSISYQISDYTLVESNHVTHSGAKVIGTLDNKSTIWNSRFMRIAIVTTDKNFIPIVHLYFGEFSGTNWEGRIFDTLEQAYLWVKSEG